MICNAFALKKALFMRLSGSKNGKVVYYHYAACLCVTAEIWTFQSRINTISKDGKQIKQKRLTVEPLGTFSDIVYGKDIM